MAQILYNQGKYKPQKCQLCDGPLAEGFVDGKTQMGPWAVMCLACHRVKGWGLGLGRGQRYDARGVKIGG